MRASVGILITFLLSSAAYAEDMATLDTILQGNPEETYALVRCAAFYRANLNWAGEAIEKSAVDQATEVIAALLYTATMIRSEKTGESFEAALDPVRADAAAITQLYAENYRRSYALRGAAWDGNALWESDASTCKPIGASALKMIAALQSEAIE